MSWVCVEAAGAAATVVGHVLELSLNALVHSASMSSLFIYLLRIWAVLTKTLTKEYHKRECFHSRTEYLSPGRHLSLHCQDGWFERNAFPESHLLRGGHSTVPLSGNSTSARTRDCSVALFLVPQEVAWESLCKLQGVVNQLVFSQEGRMQDYSTWKTHACIPDFVKQFADRV
jgi:hypothetical protein